MHIHVWARWLILCILIAILVYFQLHLTRIWWCVCVCVCVCMCVCVCVCLSLKSHLTSGASVHTEIDVMPLTGNEGKNVCGDFSEIAPLRRYTTSCIVFVQSAILLRETPMHIAFLPVSSTAEAADVRSRASVCSWFAKNTAYRCSWLVCSLFTIGW